MGKIKLLDDELINKIAAGEVVEKPASVVKELIENSVDSGANIITVELNEGGKSLIKVTDNGSGMEREDAENSILRHATSKISKTDDLFNIKSLGFRGEALASIAAVSNLKLITKTKESIEGTKVLVSGSKIIKVESIGAPNGTTVEVSDLFFNTPARKKYLKNMKTELNSVIDIVTRYALLHPEISFKLIHDSNAIVNSPASEDVLGTILNIYGKDLAKSMVSIENVSEDISVKGFISKPEFSRADKDWISVFVNGRYIKSKIISDAIIDSYHTLLHSNRYPAAIIIIELEPIKVDVNVHPQKTEIKFSSEQKVYETVLDSCKKALSDVSLIPEISPNDKQSVLVTAKTIPKPKVAEKIYESKPLQTALISVTETVEAETEKLPKMTILGLIHNCYIAAEDKDGFLLCDMHAAEERIRYERLMKQYENKGIEVQELLSPMQIELSSIDSNVVGSNLKLLDKFGFRLEDFGNNSFILRTVPMIIKKQLNKDLILDIIAELKQNRFKTINEIKESIIARMACRGSVKQGERIEVSQMYKILKELHTCENPYTCPHGRPTIIKFTKSYLEKKFKRTM